MVLLPRRWMLVFLVFLTSVLSPQIWRGTATAAPAPSDVFPLKTYERELSNGLKVIVVPTGFPQIVSLQIPVQTGARNEVEEGKTGFAHFFEHMMFRGTQANPPDVYQAYLQKMGARQNAYTSNDYTNYHTTFGKDDLELMLRLEADRFMNLSFDESAFKTEARAVLGEYNKNSAEPANKLWEVTKDAAFSRHTYKHTVIGFLPDVENMPNQYAYAKTFFDRWYRPEYTSIIVSGDVDPEATFKLVEKYFKPWKRGSYKVTIPVEPAPAGPIYQHVSWESPTLAQLLIGFHGPAFAADDRDYAALRLLFELAFGETSAVYKRLVLSEQKLSALSASPSDSKDPDLYTINAEVKDPKDIVAIRDSLLAAAQKYAAEPVSRAELDAVRSHERYALGRHLDTTENIAGLLAALVHYERRADTLNRLYRAAEKVTPADVQRVAQKLFTDKNLVVTTLSKDALPAAIAQVPSLRTLAKTSVPPALDASVPLIVQKNAVPFLNIKIQFKTGSAYDPQGKEGLAALAGQMVTEAGTRQMRYEELQQALYPYAASFSSQVDKELTTFTLSVHRDHAATVLDLLLPNIIAAGLRPDDFTRLKSEQENALKIGLRTNNEEELGKERLQELIFAHTVYEHPVLGTLAGLEATTPADVQNFMSNQYTQAALQIGINGDVPPELVTKLKTDLAALPRGKAAAPLAIKAKPLAGLQVNIIEKPTRATAMSIGHALDVTRGQPDFAALWLARAWLGEHRSSMSHLFQRIREVRGLNYGDYAYIEAFPGGMYSFFPSPNVPRRAQIFELWLRPVMPENAHMTLRIALYELNRLLDQGLTAAQFEETRAYLLKNVYLMTATQNAQIGYALDSRWYGTEPYTDYMRKELNRLTVGEVNAALRRHLSSKNLQVVIVTADAKGLRDKLTSDSPSPIVYDGEKPAELLAEDRIIGALPLGIKLDQVTITPIDAVFQGPAIKSSSVR